MRNPHDEVLPVVPDTPARPRAYGPCIPHLLDACPEDYKSGRTSELEIAHLFDFVLRRTPLSG